MGEESVQRLSVSIQVVFFCCRCSWWGALTGSMRLGDSSEMKVNKEEGGREQELLHVLLVVQVLI